MIKALKSQALVNVALADLARRESEPEAPWLANEPGAESPGLGHGADR
jgi:hypothetical protein